MPHPTASQRLLDFCLCVSTPSVCCYLTGKHLGRETIWRAQLRRANLTRSKAAQRHQTGPSGSSGTHGKVPTRGVAGGCEFIAAPAEQPSSQAGKREQWQQPEVAVARAVIPAAAAVASSSGAVVPAAAACAYLAGQATAAIQWQQQWWEQQWAEVPLQVDAAGAQQWRQWWQWRQLCRAGAQDAAGGAGSSSNSSETSSSSGDGRSMPSAAGLAEHTAAEAAAAVAADVAVVNSPTYSSPMQRSLVAIKLQDPPGTGTMHPAAAFDRLRAKARHC